MKISIIKEDSSIVIDGLGYSDLDLSSVASTIHAIQFDTEINSGHIEYNDGSANEVITSISTYQSIVDAHISQKETKDAEVATKATEKIALEATYRWKRQNEYPSLNDFAEAYTEKEIGDNSTKWDAYVINYNKVRTDNPKG